MTKGGKAILSILSWPWKDEDAVEFYVCKVLSYRLTDQMDKNLFYALNPEAPIGLSASDFPEIHRSKVVVSEFRGPTLRLLEGICAIPTAELGVSKVSEVIFSLISTME